MSWCDIYSYWRCPNCSNENRYNLTWQHFMEFEEIPHKEYSKEKCEHCGKEYYVGKGEPNPNSFKMDKGKCKNDYIKNMVLDVNENLTLVNEYWTR